MLGDADYNLHTVNDYCVAFRCLVIVSWIQMENLVWARILATMASKSGLDLSGELSQEALKNGWSRSKTEFGG
jgi:hypothetical protein